MTTKNIKPSVLILEDESSLSLVLESTIRQHAKVDYVVAFSDLEAAKEEVKGMEPRGYELKVVVVDQVLHDKVSGNKRFWGIEFLRWIKGEYPRCYRILCSGQSTRSEIQMMLDEQLINHFQSKTFKLDISGPTSKDLEDSDCAEYIALKIKAVIEENDYGQGNVRNPSEDTAFNQFIKKWIDALPNGAHTKLQSLSGEHFLAGDLLTNSKLATPFRDAFLASKLDGLVLEEKVSGS